MKKRLTILAFLITGLIIDGLAQLHVKGTPVAAKEDLPVEVSYIRPVKEDTNNRNNNNKEYPLYAGYIAGFSNRAEKPGTWSFSKNGNAVWRLGITVKEAKGLNVYFENVNLKNGQQLFIYDPGLKTVLGAFSQINNGNSLATELIPGDSLIIELDSPKKTSILPFTISDVGVSVLNTDRN